MKARKEDGGQIIIYNELPSKFRGVTGNYIGGFHLSDVATLEQEGFFDVLTPSYNHVLEVLSPIYFDEEKKVFTYKVEPNPTLPTIEQAKINKITELKKQTREKLNETDWYYIRELRLKGTGKIKEVPQHIIKQNDDLYDITDKKEAEINALTDLEAILTFDTSVVKVPAMIETPIIPEVAKDVLPSTEVDLSAYTVALLAVKEGDYTTDSWATYQSVLSANIVTEANTQAEVDVAVDNIKKAQNSLTLLSTDSTSTSTPDTSSTDGVSTTSQSSAIPTPESSPSPAPVAIETSTPSNPDPAPSSPQTPITNPAPAPITDPTSTPAPSTEPPPTI